MADTFNCIYARTDTNIVTVRLSHNRGDAREMGEVHRKRVNSTNSLSPDETSPASISHLLYLISMECDDSITPRVAEFLSNAHISSLKGDFTAALGYLENITEPGTISRRLFKEITALRMMLISILRENPEPPDCPARLDRPTGYDPVYIVRLCTESNRRWHSGEIFHGLRLNRRAIHWSRDALSIWQLYSKLLLIKKLTDIHASRQAHKLIEDLQDFIRSAGLEVFTALPDSLHSLLQLQSSRPEKALETTTRTLHEASFRNCAMGVKLSLSVAAAAHLSLGDLTVAEGYLDRFHKQESDLVLSDSIIRTAYIDMGLLKAREGPVAAAERLLEEWDLLGTQSPCFVEDPTRAAWIITVALRARNAHLADLALQAIHRLAHNNQGVHAVNLAAEYARTAFRGVDLPVPFQLDPPAGGTRSRSTRRRPPSGVISIPAARASIPMARSSPGPGARAGRSRPAPAAMSKVPPAKAPVAATAPASKAAAGPRPGCSPLTPREVDVARLVALGRTNQQIAQTLSISPHTVNFHLRQIFGKLSISSRAQIGYYIAHQGIQDTPESETLRLGWPGELGDFELRLRAKLRRGRGGRRPQLGTGRNV